MTGTLGMVSTLALAPALIGMVAGQVIRHRLSETRFRQVFFAAILLLGVYIAVNAVI
jgi:uncharacterized membrane protein YfcA